MKIIAFSIFDRAAGAYLRPFFVQSDGQAIRSFSDIACDAEHEIGKHPEDYSLARIGLFDDNKGQFVPENVEFIMTGLKAVSESRTVNKSQLEAFQDSVSPNGG